jgi:hypothetical protein
MTNRWVDIDGLHNVRDLGGVPLADGGTTAFGVVLRGETVVHLTAAGADTFRSLGVRHVLDLREPSERDLDGDGPLEAAYQRSDVLHELVPLVHASVLDDPIGRVSEASAVGDQYATYLHNGGFRLADALARTAWSRCALYVHCAVGKDRTGIVSALLLKLAGADDDAVVEDYLMTAERLVPVLMRLGARPAYPHLAAPDWAAQQPSEEAMRLFLGHLRARGGAAHWLLDHGVDSETLALLVGRLRGEPASMARIDDAERRLVG